MWFAYKQQCITKLPDLLLCFLCVSCFFLYLLIRLSFFSQMRVFFFLFCISIMTLLFVFAWLFHLSSTTTYSLSDGYHNITQWKAQESTDLACKTKVFVLCFGRSVNTAHLPAHPCSSTALVWLWKKVCWLTFLFYCNICVVCVTILERSKFLLFCYHRFV